MAVVGATASGKSALAHEVARSLTNVEIGTVDSMTVYRGMDLGTAKPTRAERDEVTYHLLDLADPSEDFTVAAFQRAARDVEEARRHEGGGLIYVGGTGLYGRAVLDGLTIPGQYPEVRAELEQRAEVDLPALYRDLQERDPLAASRMEPTNARRVVRALEVTLGSGRPFSSFGDGLEVYAHERVPQIGLRVPLEVLDQRIDERFARWMDEGLLGEVSSLAARPEGLSRTARQAVGYKELLAHVAGEISLADAVTRAVTATKRLARRQRSWFTRDPRVRWFEDAAEAAAAVRDVLTGSDANVGN